MIVNFVGGTLIAQPIFIERVLMHVINHPNAYIEIQDIRTGSYIFIPTSPPTQKIESTKPASIAGINVGKGLTIQCLQMLPFKPKDCA